MLKLGTLPGACGAGSWERSENRLTCVTAGLTRGLPRVVTARATAGRPYRSSALPATKILHT